MVFLIDLPRHKNGHITAFDDLTHFGQQLTYFLEAKGLPEQVVKSLRNFDFSCTNELDFVHSM